jgi:hypothetical protein
MTPSLVVQLLNPGDIEGISYAIVQYFFSSVWVVTVGAAYSRSDAAVPVGPTDVTDGEIRATKNYVIEENWTQDLSSDTILEDSPTPV